MNSLLLQYTYLQALDTLTTIVFLRNGFLEANPIVRNMIELCSSPVLGLVAIKVMGLLLGVYCWHANRHKALVKANVFFALLVIWNLLVLVAFGSNKPVMAAWGNAA
jgi:hypothetical protein